MNSSSGFTVEDTVAERNCVVCGGERIAPYMSAILTQLSECELKHLGACMALKRYLEVIIVDYGIDGPTELRDYLKNHWGYIENIAVEKVISSITSSQAFI